MIKIAIVEITRVSAHIGPPSHFCAGFFQETFHFSIPSEVVNYDSSTPTPVNRSYIEKCLQSAWQKRTDWALKGLLDLAPSSAFRLLHENFDGTPGLSVEIFGSYAIIHVYSRHWLQEIRFIANWIISRSAESWGRPIVGVYLADHIRDELHLQAKEQAAISGVVANRCIAGQAARGHRTTIIENGCMYNISLANGSATGLYLDQRQNRLKLAELLKKLPTEPSSKVRMMLNAFSYTGSFSIAATKALPNLQTINVDPSASAAEVAISNFKLNKIDAANHKFQTKDVFSSMTAMDNINAQFDLVVLDPPTVSRIRRPDGKLFTFSTSSNYDELVALAAPLVAPGGYMVTFMNTRTLDAEKWEQSVQKGISSIVDRKKELFEFLKFAEKRKQLRKRPDLRKKPRDRLLEQMMKKGEFQVSKEDVEKMYSFTKIDQWTQDIDFSWHPSDEAGQYLHGLVFQRSSFVSDGLKLPPAPSLITTAHKNEAPVRKRVSKRSKPTE